VTTAVVATGVTIVVVVVVLSGTTVVVVANSVCVTAWTGASGK